MSMDPNIWVETLPKSKKKGDPGGCGTPNI